jgi:hypothetical protein
MAYSRQKIIEKIEDAKDNMQTFYKSDFINYRGKTSDTDEYYTEIVCEWLLKNLDLLNEIPTITREKGYLTKTHDGVIRNLKSNRDEEIIAMRMFNQSEIKGIGKILDYQTPLKNKSSDKAGKIDLLSYDGDVLRILELKKPDSDETMLRCIIEGYTYLKTFDDKKLLQDFKLPQDTKIEANPFVFVGSIAYDEMFEDRPNLKKLIQVLNCKPLFIKCEKEKYVVEE